MNIKKFIAKEGLIFLGFIITAILFMAFDGFISGDMGIFSLMFLIYGYPFYWVVKFVIWAIKILKDDKS